MAAICHHVGVKPIISKRVLMSQGWAVGMVALVVHISQRQRKAQLEGVSQGWFRSGLRY